MQNNKVIDLDGLRTVDIGLTTKLKQAGNFTFIDIEFDDIKTLDKYEVFRKIDDGELIPIKQFKFSQYGKLFKGSKHTYRDINVITANKKKKDTDYTYCVLGSSSGYPTKNFSSPKIFVEKEKASK